MLEEIAIDLEKVREEDRHKVILCVGMIAGYDSGIGCCEFV